MPQTLPDFVIWFYNIFLKPIIHLLQNHSVFGFSLWVWFLSFTVVNLAVRFFRSFFGNDSDD